MVMPLATIGLLFMIWLAITGINRRLTAIATELRKLRTDDSERHGAF